jgi:hypothetical protein
MIHLKRMVHVNLKDRKYNIFQIFRSKQGVLPNVVKLKTSLRKFYGRQHDLVDHYGIFVTNDYGYVPLVVNTSQFFPHSWLITGFVTRLTWRHPEQELLTLSEHQGSPPVFSGVRVNQSLVLCACFVYCFVLLYYFFWPLCCLFFFDIQILITNLVSLNSSSRCCA